MGQTASQQIEDHIEDQREDLSSNLRELEYRVKEVADWRHQFENHPMAFLGLAFGGGLLLSKAIGGSRGGRHKHYYYAGPNASAGKEVSKPSKSSPPSPAVEQAQHAWENVKGALIGIAVTRLKDYVDGVVPGFSAHYRQAEAEHGVKSHV